MEFKELIEKRRSIRKFSERAVPREVVDRILHETLSAPSARNTRTTHLVVVDDPALVARMADMRDYGSAFMKGAPLAIVVLGGMGSQFAVILAAILLVVSRELMRDFNEYSMLMLGGLMVLMMIWRPQGLLPMTRVQLKLKNGQAKGEQA